MVGDVPCERRRKDSYATTRRVLRHLLWRRCGCHFGGFCPKRCFWVVVACPFAITRRGFLRFPLGFSSLTTRLLSTRFFAGLLAHCCLRQARTGADKSLRADCGDGGSTVTRAGEDPSLRSRRGPWPSRSFGTDPLLSSRVGKRIGESGQAWNQVDVLGPDTASPGISGHPPLKAVRMGCSETATHGRHAGATLDRSRWHHDSWCCFGRHSVHIFAQPPCC